jgi:ABC-type siderophore export system fused ATPase/permease subunit
MADNTEHGLSTPLEIEALADQLTAAANALHASVVRSITAHGGKPISDAEQALARQLFDEELLLRQNANALYADKAAMVVKSLATAQAHLIDVTAAAAAKIAKITLIGDAVGLVAGLVGLAGAAASGNVALIVKSLETVRKQVKAVNADLPAVKAADAAGAAAHAAHNKPTTPTTPTTPATPTKPV